jgi:hypothetical protein
MAIHFNPLKPVAVPPKTAPTVRAHAAAPANKSAIHSSMLLRSTAPERPTDFRTLLSTAPATSGTGTTQSAVAPASQAPAYDPKASYTAEQVFGPSPWVTNPIGTGPNGITFGYNPLYFATEATAQQVAQMVGGKVVQSNEFTKDTPGTPFAQQQPNEMVQLANGALINPGLIASLYTHGYPQWEVDQYVAAQVAGALNPVGT